LCTNCEQAFSSDFLKGRDEVGNALAIRA
jgi:hypothetical protein